MPSRVVHVSRRRVNRGSAMRPRSWVVNMQHYLDEETRERARTIPVAPLEPIALLRVDRGLGDRPSPEGDWHTNVPCPRSPGRKRCLGEIVAELDRTSGYIAWQCPVCGDKGWIHGWEGTLWNRSGAGYRTPGSHDVSNEPLNRSGRGVCSREDASNCRRTRRVGWWVASNAAYGDVTRRAARSHPIFVRQISDRTPEHIVRYLYMHISDICCAQTTSKPGHLRPTL